MIYPEQLRPTTYETIQLPNGSGINVLKATPLFEAWTREPLAHSYGGKPVLAFKAEPVFAELAILRHFQRAGWQGVWVDTYRRKYRVGYWDAELARLPLGHDSVELPIPQADLLDKIRKGTGKRWSGCWDVFCWNCDQILFAEAKRHGKDQIRDSQRQWVQSALDLGLSLETFLVVEWSLSQQVLT